MEKEMNNKKSIFRNSFNNVTLQSLLSDLSHAISLERLGPKLTDRVFWRAATDDSVVALTFDDGPQVDYTPRLLDILNQFEVSATFFLIGKHIESHFDLAQQIVRAGHEVGNHTLTHPALFRLTEEQMTYEITRTDELLRSLDGAEPRFLRPPMGLFTKRVLDIVEQLGYKTVVGDVYPRDSHLPGQEKIVRRVLSRVITGSIIILHDGGNSVQIDRTQTLAAVQEIIPQLKSRGFDFVTLSRLLSR
jgi:peptidoglycan/xylan/chitin deacetylase (PgdA/CDA1 family)